MFKIYNMDLSDYLSNDFQWLTLKKMNEVTNRGLYNSTVKNRNLILNEIKLDNIKIDGSTFEFAHFISDELGDLISFNFIYENLSNNGYNINDYIKNSDIVRIALHGIIYTLQYPKVENFISEQITLNNISYELNFKYEIEKSYNFIKDNISDESILKIKKELTIKDTNFWQTRDYFDDFYNIYDFLKKNNVKIDGHQIGNFITKSEVIMEKYLTEKFSNSLLELVEYAIDKDLMWPVS